MKTKIFILHLFLLFGQYAFAFSQTNTKSTPKPITISGYVPDSIVKQLGDTLQLFLHSRYDYNLWHEGDYKYVKIVNNRFSVTFQPKGNFSYFQIRNIADRLPAIYLQSLEYDAFLINSGANININFRNYQNATVTGDDSKIINYQNFAGKLALSWGRDWGKYPTNIERITYWRELENSHLKLAMDSLNRIKPFISENTYKILSFNTASAIFQSHLDHLTNIAFRNKDVTYLNAVRDELQLIDLQLRGFSCDDPIILKSSSGYISYLANFQKKYVDMIMGQEATSFEDLYKKIVNDYKGELRDKILTYNIISSFERRGSQQYVKQALSIVKDAESKKTIEKINNLKSPGVDAFDFSFADIHNKQVKLKDLRGKVIVIEAYFNGCSGCVGLSKRMHPIIESYKDNKNVVFISLSVDKQRESFLHTVKQGIYGSESSLYLNTNGLGWEHPICQQYQWSSYPQMLLIDKNGKLITAEKVDPINESSKSHLLSLINNNI